MSDGESSQLEADSKAIIKKLSEFKMHHSRKKDRIKTLEIRIGLLENEIQAIRDSISWRVTGPLRKVWGALRREGR